MSSIVITSEDVFADSDAQRPAATITRVGGGQYSVTGFIGDKTVGQRVFPTLQDAEAAAAAHSDGIDATPATPQEKLDLTNTIRDQASQISTLVEQVAALQRQLADAKAPLSAEAVKE